MTELPIIYLAPRLLAGSSELPNLLLHPGKDLAVSPSCYHEAYPEGYLWLSPQALLFAPLSSMMKKSSSSRMTGVTRYQSVRYRTVSVRTFLSPLLIMKSDGTADFKQGIYIKEFVICQ